MQRIIFEAETLDELVRKCKAFIGVNVPVAPVGTGHVVNTWPVPSWAPKGSKWIARVTPPILIGPDANEIPIRWVAGTPQKIQRMKDL